MINWRDFLEIFASGHVALIASRIAHFPIQHITSKAQKSDSFKSIFLQFGYQHHWEGLQKYSYSFHLFFLFLCLILGLRLALRYLFQRDLSFLPSSSAYMTSEQIKQEHR